ncbi:unnamed protein product [Owenia fusiformis]|uniref:Uncharacterized protein n=1 Tax=Owenia fusiformis TaxID=6347 RepID=A0A8J1U9R6_OWEFU|nr:unnamed protein product [Owenia fusiformis]
MAAAANNPHPKFKEIDKEYRKLLFELSQKLTRDNSERLAYVLKFQEEFKTSIELLHKLEKINVFSIERLDELKKAFEVIKLHALNDCIEEFETWAKPYLNKRLIRRFSSCDGSCLIGREAELEEIIQTLMSGGQSNRRDGINSVLLYGFPGHGKTTLALEALTQMSTYERYPQDSLIEINLKNHVSCKEVYQSLMKELDLGVMSNLNDSRKVLHDYLKELDQDTIIFFDNADGLLQPEGDEEHKAQRSMFIKFLRHVICKTSPYVRVLMTSRYALPEPTPGGYIPIHQMNLKRLSLDESKELLNFNLLTERTERIQIQPEEEDRIIELCDRHPLGIKVVASRLKQLTIKPKDIIKILSPNTEHTTAQQKRGRFREKKKSSSSFQQLHEDPNISEDENLDYIFQNMFEYLKDLQKCSLVYLAIFPGAFSVRDAAAIMNVSEEDARFQLDSLIKLNFVEQQTPLDFGTQKTGQLRYNLHTNIHHFLTELPAGSFKLENDPQSLAEVRAEGKNNFMKYFHKQLGKVSKLSDENYQKAYYKLQRNRANFKTLYEFDLLEPHFESDLTESSFLLEMFLIPRQRRDWFERRAKVAFERGERERFVTNQCTMIVVQADLNCRIDELEPLLNEVNNHILAFDDGYVKQRVLPLYYNARGISHLNSGDLNIAIESLEKAYEIRKELLPNTSVTCRTLNDLGAAYFKRSCVLNSPTRATDIEKSMMYQLNAVNMRKSLGVNHFDYPLYLHNIATNYYQQGKDHYEEALRYIQEALDINDSLKMMTFAKKADLYFTQAYIIFQKDRKAGLKNALEPAKKALEMRKKAKGICTETARSYYQVGLILFNQAKYQEALDHFYEQFKLECSALRMGKNHSGENFHSMMERIKNCCEKLGRDPVYYLDEQETITKGH